MERIADPSTRGELVRRGFQLAAVAAIADGRLQEAQQLLEAASRVPVRTSGQCRYCGCTELHSCAVVVPGTESPEAWTESVIVRCQWVDPERTVCSALGCLYRWQLDGLDDGLDTGLYARLVLP